MIARDVGVFARNFGELPATQPFDNAARLESSRENAPLTKTSRLSRDSANMNGSTSRAVNLFRPFNSGSNSSRYGTFRIGATFVYFHSSSRVVGKLSDSKARPLFRAGSGATPSRAPRALEPTVYMPKRYYLSL